MEAYRIDLKQKVAHNAINTKVTNEQFNTV